MMNKITSNHQKGQILVLAIVVCGLVLLNTLIIVAGSQTFFNNTNYNIQATQAENLAEAGVDKAVSSLNASGGSYGGETETLLGAGSFSVNITTPDTSTKIIEATGYVPSKANSKAKRTIKITTSKGVGVSFKYGVQVGEGGLEMSENSTVNGSVYSNGNITMGNNTKINGDAYVAGGTVSAPDQQSDCLDPGCGNFIFGKNVSGNNVLDVAQSFQPAASNYLNKISLKLKKYGLPSDITVRILENTGGNPDKSKVLSSGTLTANLVTGSYGFVDITFPSPPYLTAGRTYWIVVDTSAHSSDYWSWSADVLEGYLLGSALWSTNWQAGTPVWNATTVDLGFKTYMGGLITSIQGASGATVTGDAHAHSLSNLAITKDAYYQTSQNINVGGTKYPDSADPPTAMMPVSEANIQAWKDAAASAGVYTGNITSCRSQLGPGEYIGNISFSNNCIVTVKDPIWITGNLSIQNNVTLKLDSSYGAASGVMVIDGQISLSNNAIIQGTGTSGSTLMALSTFDSRTNGLKAIDVSNGGNAGVLYAPWGRADIENNNILNELTAWKISLENGVTINYTQGLSSAFFSSGPSGSYSVIKGTYQLK